MKDEYDVIIIGAGPAGLSCAIELQRLKKTILILEKNKEIGPKICAGGITAKVESMGLLFNMADIVFSSVKINTFKKAKIISSDSPFVATIDRGRLGRMLLEKLSGNIEVKTGTIVSKINNNSIEVAGRKIKYKYLVGADGSNSIVRRFLGLRSKKFLIALQYIVPQQFKHLELFLDASLFKSGYAWIFPHKGYASIGCGMDGRYAKNQELKNNFEKWLSLRNIDVKGAKLQAGIINFDYRGFDFGNKFLIGDAAGLASGLTGEGIYFAMVSGGEVAKKIADSSYDCQEVFKILKIKRAHERTLDFALLLVSINKSLLNFCFRLLLFFFNFKWFTKKALKLYS